MFGIEPHWYTDTMPFTLLKDDLKDKTFTNPPQMTYLNVVLRIMDKDVCREVIVIDVCLDSRVLLPFKCDKYPIDTGMENNRTEDNVIYCTVLVKCFPNHCLRFSP